MTDNIEKVAEFHTRFRIANNESPTLLTEDEAMLRFNLLKEENEEYLEACRSGNLVEIADALGDVLYIAFGTILRHGLQDHIQAVFDEIQRSNLSKLGPDGQPIYRVDGKVLKGPGYTPPNISQILGINR